MTPGLWLVFALVGIASIVMIAGALLTAPKNKDVDR